MRNAFAGLWSAASPVGLMGPRPRSALIFTRTSEPTRSHVTLSFGVRWPCYISANLIAGDGS